MTECCVCGRPAIDGSFCLGCGASELCDEAQDELRWANLRELPPERRARGVGLVLASARRLVRFFEMAAPAAIVQDELDLLRYALALIGLLELSCPDCGGGTHAVRDGEDELGYLECTAGCGWAPGKPSERERCLGTVDGRRCALVRDHEGECV